MRRTPGIVAAVLIGSVVLAGVAVCTVGWRSLSDAEAARERQVFSNTVDATVATVSDTLQQRVKSCQALAHWLRLMDEPITTVLHNPAEVHHALSRMTPPTSEGGAGVLQQVANDPAAVQAWEAATQAGLATGGINLDVTLHPFPNGQASVNASHLYPFMLSRGLRTGILSSRPLVGRDLGAEPVRRAAIDAAVAAAANGTTAVTGIVGNTASGRLALHAYEALVTASGEVLVAFSGITIAHLLAGVADESLWHLTVLDHLGVELSTGGCDPASAVVTQAAALPITDTVDWSVTLSACRGYAEFRLDSDKALLLALTAGLLVLFLAVAAALVAVVARQARVSSDIKAALAAQCAQAATTSYVLHEVRNPLHVLRGLVYPLVATTEAEGQLDVPGATPVPCCTDWTPADRLDVQSALDSLSSTVNDVLELSKFESGQIKLNPRWMSCSALADMAALCRSYMPHGVGLTLRVLADSAGLPPRVHLDARRLQQIVRNGASNAGKFALEGTDVVFTVAVLSGPAQSPAAQQVLVLDISNAGRTGGVGTAKQAEHLFVPFHGRVHKLRSTVSRSSVGSAASGSASSFSGAPRVNELEIARRAELRRLWETLVAGDGLTVDRETAVDASGGAAPSTSTGLGLVLSRKIAVALGGWLGLEDHGDGRTHFWCAVPVKSSLHTVVEVGEPAPAGAGAGTSAGAAVPRTLPPICPPVADAGDANPADAHATQADAGDANPADGRACGHRGPLIVVVDDERANLRLLGRLLRKLGFTNVTQLPDGQDLVDLIDSGACPALVLCDIIMDGLSGLEAMAAVAGLCERRGTPIPYVVAVTGSMQPSTQETIRRAGFRGIVGKPFSRKGLSYALRKAGVVRSGALGAADHEWFVVDETF